MVTVGLRVREGMALWSGVGDTDPTMVRVRGVSIDTAIVPVGAIWGSGTFATVLA
jgi:hypothetical protein